MKTFMIPDSYERVTEKEVKELNSVGAVLRHKKSGAKLFLLSNDDNNKVFTIGFRTPVSDSTGVPHIMEHSVLCGSDKFPVKDPFVELVKGSLNTFLNAMTYPDKTLYPVASCNDKDFQNLMNVYLDAVFHPAIYQNRKIFMQEGWHYELEDPDGPLTINGVVYNEMKGVFSSPESVLDRYTKSVLFPDTTYRFESGGDPEEIPSLTYEDFLAFHQTYYHPSNSYIYLYGDMDMTEKLEFLDREYLKEYDAAPVDSKIEIQKITAPGKEYEAFYSIGEEEDPAEKTYLSVNRIVGTDLEPKLYLAFQILEHILLNAPGAPLKQALLDAGIGTDVFGGYESGILQPVFSVIIKNASKEKKEEFLSIVQETLEKLAAEGINARSIDAGINYFEFKYREADFGPYPRGLMYGLQCFDSWLYEETDPFMHLEYEETFAWIKQQKAHGYFEQLIRDYLLDPKLQTVIILSPKKGLDQEKEAELAEKLEEMRMAMTEAEKQALITQTAQLKKYQQEPSPEEELAKIPLLSISDIEPKAEGPKGVLKNCASVPILHSDLFTGGIGYLKLAFDASFVPHADWPYLGLLKTLLGLVSTKQHSYLELSNEIHMETGGIGTEFGSYLMPELNGDFALSLEVSGKALYQKQDKLLGFVDEILHSSDLREEKRIKEVLAQVKSRLKERMLSSGHSTAIVRAGSYHSAASAFRDATAGITYYHFLTELLEHFEERKEALYEKLETLTAQIFTAEHLFADYTGTQEGFALLTDAFPAFAKTLAHSEKKAFPLGRVKAEEVPAEKKNEGFKTASQVQYVARCGNFRREGYEYTGALKILQVILSYEYLWIQVRVKGGAYGVMSGCGRSGDGYFVSYRDPHLKKTSEVFEQVPDYLESFEASDRDMTKYIIGTISGMDTPLTPSAKGVRDLSLFLSGITEEMLQKERDEVLNASQEDIRALAGICRAILKNGEICAIGGEGKIETEKELFDTVKSLV